MAKMDARKHKIDMPIEDEIRSGRDDCYSPQYFISWLGNFMLHCARQLPDTKGLISRKFLKKHFALNHGNAGGTSRILGTYTDSLITMKQ